MSNVVIGNIMIGIGAAGFGALSIYNFRKKNAYVGLTLAAFAVAAVVTLFIPA